MARSTVAVKFTGDVANLQRAIGQVNGKLGGLGSGVSKVAGLIGGAFVADKAISFAGDLVKAAEESNKVTADTAAVLKSMGVEAEGAAEGVAKLSTKLSNKTGVDDEVIQSAQNVLLTFSSMADSVANGSDLMERSSAVALDMSARLGTDLSSAAMLVGKALNDPARGMAALRRSGVQLTKQQEEQVKAMVAAGDAAGAQGVLLAELERQFKGSAEAQATSTDKARVAWGNLQEQLGEKLLPVVNKVATWLSANLPTAMARGQAAFERIRPHIENVIALVREHWPQIQQTITSVMETVASVVSSVLAVVRVLWENFGNNVLEFVRRVWPAISQTIRGALTVIRNVVKLVTSLIKGDWSGAWDAVKGIVSGAWNAIQGIVKGALEVLRGVIGVGLEIVGSVFKRAWSSLTGWFWSIPSKMREIAGRIWEGLKSGLSAAIRWIRDQLDRLLGPLDEIAGKVGGIVGKIGGGIGGGLSAAKGLLGLASGGPVNAGQTYLVGEEGPELFVSRTAGRIIPNGQTAGMMAAAAAGVTYQINVTVGPTSDPGHVGQKIVEAIKAYERRNGAGWRR